MNCDTSWYILSHSFRRAREMSSPSTSTSTSSTQLLDYMRSRVSCNEDVDVVDDILNFAGRAQQDVMAWLALGLGRLGIFQRLKRLNFAFSPSLVLDGVRILAGKDLFVARFGPLSSDRQLRITLILEFLLKHCKLDPDYGDGPDDNALVLACSYCDDDVVRLLLDCEASPGIYGSAPLLYALLHQRRGAITHLVRAGAPVSEHCRMLAKIHNISLDASSVDASSVDALARSPTRAVSFRLPE